MLICDVGVVVILELHKIFLLYPLSWVRTLELPFSQREYKYFITDRTVHMKIHVILYNIVIENPADIPMLLLY